MSSPSGLAWGARKGIIASLRLADDIPGSGQGFRLLPFTAAVSSGVSGGPLVDSQGALLGIITKRIARGPGGASAEGGFAPPIETVIGLADGSGKQALGSGVALQMPASRPSASTAAVVDSSGQDIFRTARTLHMACRAMWFTPDSLEKALAGQKGFDGLGLRIVKETRVADLLVTVDRPLLIYTFTYLVTDQRTSILLDWGKVTAIGAGTAAARIAKQLLSKWAKARSPGAAPSPKDRDSAGPLAAGTPASRMPNWRAAIPTSPQLPAV